jgi:hypothetical protein
MDSSSHRHQVNTLGLKSRVFRFGNPVRNSWIMRSLGDHFFAIVCGNDLIEAIS